MPAAPSTDGPPAGVILAGGRSKRMGGTPKALAPLAARPLLQHVIDRVAPQVDELYLSVEKTSKALGAFGLRQVPDPEPDAGPLAGMLAAMQQMAAERHWLLLVPCDAPFLPSDLAMCLLDCAARSSLPGAVVSYRCELQPTFSIWHRSILQRLEQAVDRDGMAGFKQFLEVVETATLEWPRADPSPFFNINDRQSLVDAGRILDQHVRTR
ncbi:MAG: molybdenum cofactor guanylyltransferase [Xanthomonadales bacterium]|nr:molybdenum cofactor guanylyltransferase [Gammaproteobacteria bacterium]MBT8053287.1 molybdenum cofactor guanylyltransferase [Gammaproteobacteria bacterium]NND58476.1 molybdenum cofactor guanylyltransferase [Xanthomonadales bacterium]NNK50103.1 molybdenum cofactor guanylyltransferase [Xanthomonadales bacterium]